MAKLHSVIWECTGIWTIIHHLCLQYFKGYSIWINLNLQKNPFILQKGLAHFPHRALQKCFQALVTGAHLCRPDYKFKRKHWSAPGLATTSWHNLRVGALSYKVRTCVIKATLTVPPQPKSKLLLLLATTTAWRQGHERKLATHGLSMLF